MDHVWNMYGVCFTILCFVLAMVSVVCPRMCWCCFVSGAEGCLYCAWKCMVCAIQIHAVPVDI